MISVSGQSYNNGIKFMGERYTVSFSDEHGKTRITVKQNVLKETSLLNDFSSSGTITLNVSLLPSV